jgi:hypothetical protein
VILGKIAIGMLGTAVAAGAILSSEGMITVRVREKAPKGSHVLVIAPAMLVPIGMHFVPKENLQEAGAQIRPWLPTIRAAIDELGKCDDSTFVEVIDPTEQVRVTKSGGSIVVDVDDAKETVHVSAPLRAVRQAIEQLAAAGPRV